MLTTLPIISGAYESRSINIDYQQCINMYPETETPESKNVVSLISTPGMKIFGNSTRDFLSTVSRGIYTTSTGRLLHVVGKNVIEYRANGTTINYTGELLTLSGPVSITDNGVHVVIVDGTYGYTFELSSGSISRITDAEFPNGATHVAFKDGYIVANQPLTQQYNIYWSDIYDATTWNALNVSSAEGLADKLLALAKTNNDIWCFGEKSTEVFTNTGDPDLVFARINGAFFDIGIGAKYSAATNGNTVFWLGSNANGNNIVFMATGYSPQRISTHAIEYALSQMDKTDDAVGFCYQQEGHFFYLLTFGSGNKTFVYDMTTGLWHRRASYDYRVDKENRYRPVYNTVFANKNLVCDILTSAVYELDLDYYLEDFYDPNLSEIQHNPIVRTRTTPHNHSMNKRLFYSCLELDMQKGVGLTSGQGDVPTVMLRYSDDGGYTWSSIKRSELGLKGKYKKRIRFTRLGSSRDRIFEIKISDPVKVILINAYVEVS